MILYYIQDLIRECFGGKLIKEQIEYDMLHFQHENTKYFRAGRKIIIWEKEGDLWTINPDGTRGSYAGKILSSGQIDSRKDDEPVIQ